MAAVMVIAAAAAQILHKYSASGESSKKCKIDKLIFRTVIDFLSYHAYNADMHAILSHG